MISPSPSKKLKKVRGNKVTEHRKVRGEETGF